MFPRQTVPSLLVVSVLVLEPRGVEADARRSVSVHGLPLLPSPLRCPPLRQLRSSHLEIGLIFIAGPCGRHSGSQCEE